MSSKEKKSYEKKSYEKKSYEKKKNKTRAQRHANNQLQPIYRLPNEILEIIFVLSRPLALERPVPGTADFYFSYMRASGVLDYARLLGRVSQRWRDVTRGCPALWSHIYIHAGVFPVFGRYEQRHYEMALQLSKDYPLTISIAVGKDGCMPILRGPLFAPHIPRIRALYIDMTSSFAMSQRVLPLFPEVDTPLLEIIHIDFGCSAPVAAMYLGSLAIDYAQDIPDVAGGAPRQHKRLTRNAPLLHEVLLEGLGMDNPHMMETGASDTYAVQHLGPAGVHWENLTRLRLPDMPVSAASLVKVIARATRLTELRCAIHEEMDPEDLIELMDEEDSFSDPEDERSGERHDTDTRQGRTPGNTGLGLHVFPDLEILHIVTWALDPGIYDSDVEDEYGFPTNMELLLNALVCPALTQLSITRQADELFLHMLDEYSAGLGDESQCRPGAFKLHPPLRAFLQRSRCTVRGLHLSGLSLVQQELLNIMQLCPDVRTLTLTDAVRQMSPGFWRALRRRERGGRHIYMPALRVLNVENRRESNARSGFSNMDVLDTVESRWPYRKDVSRKYHETRDMILVRVVHHPEPVRAPKNARGTPQHVLEARMRERLRMVQSRKDIMLGITELERGPPVGSDEDYDDFDDCDVVLDLEYWY